MNIVFVTGGIGCLQRLPEGHQFQLVGSHCGNVHKQPPYAHKTTSTGTSNSSVGKLGSI